MRSGAHKTVQARILKYAEAIGGAFVPCEGVERRRGFDPAVLTVSKDALAPRPRFMTW